jgi:hypothetical protein
MHWSDLMSNRDVVPSSAAAAAITRPQIRYNHHVSKSVCLLGWVTTVRFGGVWGEARNATTAVPTPPSVVWMEGERQGGGAHGAKRYNSSADTPKCGVDGRRTTGHTARNATTAVPAPSSVVWMEGERQGGGAHGGPRNMRATERMLSKQKETMGRMGRRRRMKGACFM